MVNQGKLTFNGIALNRDIITADEFILNLSVENLNGDGSNSNYALELWERGEQGRRIRTYPVVNNFWQALGLIIFGEQEAFFTVGGGIISTVEITSNFDPFVSFNDIRGGFLIRLIERKQGNQLRDIIRVMPPFEAGRKPVITRIKDPVEHPDIPVVISEDSPNNDEFEDIQQENSIRATTDDGNIFDRLANKFKGAGGVISSTLGILALGGILYFILKDKR